MSIPQTINRLFRGEKREEPKAPSPPAIYLAFLEALDEHEQIYRNHPYAMLRGIGPTDADRLSRYDRWYSDNVEQVRELAELRFPLDGLPRRAVAQYECVKRLYLHYRGFLWDKAVAEDPLLDSDGRPELDRHLPENMDRELVVWGMDFLKPLVEEFRRIRSTTEPKDVLQLQEPVMARDFHPRLRGSDFLFPWELNGALICHDDNGEAVTSTVRSYPTWVAHITRAVDAAHVTAYDLYEDMLVREGLASVQPGTWEAKAVEEWRRAKVAFEAGDYWAVIGIQAGTVLTPELRRGLRPVPPDEDLLEHPYWLWKVRYEHSHYVSESVTVIYCEQSGALARS